MFTYRDIPGHFSFADVYDAALAGVPDSAVFVEVGTWLGASAAYMAGNIKQSGKKIQFHAVDNFTAVGSRPALRSKAVELGGDFYEIFCDNLKKCGVFEYVRPLRGDSTAMAAHFADGSIDFVYIDAAHDYAKVRQDILAWLPKVKPSGVIAGHDFDEGHPGVVQAVWEIFGPKAVINMRHSWVCPQKSLAPSWWPAMSSLSTKN